MATVEELTARLTKALAGGEGFGHSVKLNLKKDGVIHVDGTRVSNEDLPADLTVTISMKDLEALGRRKLDPMAAIMTGRMKLSNMGLAMQLQPKIQALFQNIA
ncbi:MAG TPA: SCP2 sterol-binding domain-containing protein [Phenylobacterium sp.]